MNIENLNKAFGAVHMEIAAKHDFMSKNCSNKDLGREIEELELARECINDCLLNGKA